MTRDEMEMYDVLYGLLRPSAQEETYPPGLYTQEEVAAAEARERRAMETFLEKFEKNLVYKI